MNLPFEYDRVAVGEFGGTTPTTTDFEHARVVILPVPLDRTTSYVAGHAQRPARDPRRVVAHGAVGRGDRHRRPQHRHLHAAGDGVPVRDDGRGRRGDPAGGVASSSSRDKFPVVLGGEHSITPPVVAAVAETASGPVGPADRRARRSARFLHGHAAQPRVRDAARRSSTRRRRRSASAACRPEEAAAIPSLPTTIFYDFNMRARSATGWIASSSR